ncbi:MAG: OB-fold domain-containing protein [Myxococcota bacterium]
MRDDAFYWEGLAVGELRLRVCDGCGRAACPPRPGCPHCGDPNGRVRVASGEGRLHSWTVCHVAFDPAFAADVPYVVGVVELPEGARILARIEEVEVEALRDGLKLQVRWQPDRSAPAQAGEEGMVLRRLVFVPAAASDAEKGRDRDG